MKAHLKRKYLADERRVIEISASEGSGACKVHLELELNRSVIKTAMQSLDFSRRFQMIFANLICGTYFKYYNKEGDRLQVRCPLCSAVCTLSHLQTHISQQFPRGGEESDLVDYLVNLVKIADPKPKLLPLPIQNPE